MMARLRLVRHAAAAVDRREKDPGLSPLGLRQAAALAESLGGDPPGRLKFSPCRRARETAQPISAVLGLDGEIAEPYGELPWSEGQTVVQREADVGRFLDMTWPATSAAMRGWRDRLIAAARAERGDVVIVSHFVAINALVGAATADERALVFRPANASVTEFELSLTGLRLVALGMEQGR